MRDIAYIFTALIVLAIVAVIAGSKQTAPLVTSLAGFLAASTQKVESA